MHRVSTDQSTFASDMVEALFFGLMFAYVGLILALVNSPVCQ